MNTKSIQKIVNQSFLDDLEFCLAEHSDQELECELDNVIADNQLLDFLRDEDVDDVYAYIEEKYEISTSVSLTKKKNF